MILTEVIYSVINNKCPRCHTGRMFTVNSPYNFKEGLKMNDSCSHCNLSFNPESGYYFGAMFVSYGLTVGFGILWWIGFSLSGDFNFIPFIVSLGLIILFLSPVTFRWSRTIWINLFFRFHKKYKGDNILLLKEKN